MTDKIIIESEDLDCYMELGRTKCLKCNTSISEWDVFILIHRPSIDQDNNELYCNSCIKTIEFD